MTPSSNTTTRSASCKVCIRCVISNNALSLQACTTLDTAVSPCASNAEVGSSKTNKNGSDKSALANPSRWRCPPDNFDPSIPTL
mmetsp:Transcript_19699/g.29910  ORF Transcript_19699/g.29910 Transcript_19699/m.29910 type:complete len:84 (-) Transcript_19699:140-391(-)